jgi:GTP cyclohydrolase III
MDKIISNGSKSILYSNTTRISVHLFEKWKAQVQEMKVNLLPVDIIERCIVEEANAIAHIDIVANTTALGQPTFDAPDGKHSIIRAMNHTTRSHAKTASRHV